MSERAPMPPKVRAMVATDDLSAAVSGPNFRYGRRFSLTVAEDALHKLGPQVIPWVVERLAGQIAHEQQPAVTEVVGSFLHDRAWAEPIIRQAIQDTVREFVTDMLSGRGSPSGSERASPETTT